MYTIVATNEQKYTYTKGIYSSNIQLLCTAESNTAISDIKWGSSNNPLLLDSLPNEDTTLTCKKSSTSTSILHVGMEVQGEY